MVTARAIGKADAWSQRWDLSRNPQAESLSTADSSSPASKPAVKVLASNEKPKSWHQKNWLIISLLVFLPPVGIPLVWMSKWPKFSKICASIFSGLWFLSILAQQPNETQPRIAQEDTQISTTELAVGEEIEEVSAPIVDSTFADAVNSAMAAAASAQTARTSEEWGNVASLWSRAIELMKAVPQASENYQTAQQKAVEYQPNLEYAQQNLDAQVSSIPESETKSASKVLANLVSTSDDEIKDLIILASHVADYGTLSDYAELDTLGRGLVVMTILNAWIVEGKTKKTLTLEEEQKVIADLTLVLSEAAKSYPSEPAFKAATSIAVASGIIEQ